jgi:protein involved in polysaccharide export with SLBB domain
MSTTDRAPSGDPGRSRGRTAILAGALTIGLLSLGSLGCSAGKRISMHEFIRMQEDMAQAESPQPTTQPSRSTVEVWAKHAFAPYRVGPSDVLAVALTGLDEPTATTPYQVRVNRKGRISLPLVGAVQVGGLELENVELAIESAYVPSVVKNLGT